MSQADLLFRSIGYAEHGFVDYQSWLAKCTDTETTNTTAMDISPHYQAGNPMLDPAMCGDDRAVLQPRLTSIREQLLREPAVEKRGSDSPKALELASPSTP